MNKAVTPRTKRAAQTLHGQNAWLPQREVADDCEDELLELFACGPSRQRNGVEAARQLHVAVDGVSRLQDPETDERHFELVAQESQGVQDDTLFPPGTGENIVDLVDDEDLDANVAKNVDGAPLHIDDTGARAMGRIDGGED